MTEKNDGSRNIMSFDEQCKLYQVDAETMRWIMVYGSLGNDEMLRHRQELQEETQQNEEENKQGSSASGN